MTLALFINVLIIIIIIIIIISSALCRVVTVDTRLSVCRGRQNQLRTLQVGGEGVDIKSSPAAHMAKAG